MSLMNRHINKLLAVICVFSIISCSKEHDPEDDLPQISTPETASEFYLYNYWIIGAGFNYAENYIKKNNERLRATNDPCVLKIADKLEVEVEESRAALEESRQNVIKTLTKNIPEEELAPAIEYYKTTAIGKYIASEAGTAEMGKVLLTSKYKDDIAKSLENTNLSSDEKLDIVVGYMLKMQPSTETLSYTAFRNLPLWAHLENIKLKLQKAVVPYTDNSKDIATLNNELRNCPAMIPKPPVDPAVAAERRKQAAAQTAPAAPAAQPAPEGASQPTANQ